MEALSRRVNNKLAVQNPSTLPEQPGAPTYIKYTPSQQGPQYASGAKQRIIKMQDMPVDPLEPPKFRHTKVPRGTGSPPVPVMHSPPRPVTAEDQANWKIPPCISNWKNAKGYTIPLDKRLAADGRGLQVCVCVWWGGGGHHGRGGRPHLRHALLTSLSHAAASLRTWFQLMSVPWHFEA